MPLKISLCPQEMEKNDTKRREICFRAERAPGNILSGSQSLVVLQLVLLQAHTAMLLADFCLQLKPLKCTDTHNTRTQKRVNFVYPRGLIFLIIQLTSRFSGPTFFWRKRELLNAFGMGEEKCIHSQSRQAHRQQRHALVNF
jgi:hypothetical protein